MNHSEKEMIPLISHPEELVPLMNHPDGLVLALNHLEEFNCSC